MKNIAAIYFGLDDTLVDYIKADEMGIYAVKNLFDNNIDSQEFLDISVKFLIESYKLVENRELSELDIIHYRLVNLLGYFSIIWAMQRLKEYIVKGFALNDDRFNKGDSRITDDLYFYPRPNASLSS